VREAPVLLIDEVDRADEAFEAYLLELLSDFQMSIPELGTIRALTRPAVVITSNGTRELSDALRRRCLYQYIDYPSFARSSRSSRSGAAGVGRARPPGGRVRAERAPDGAAQEARHRRDARLDGGALRMGISSLDDDGAERILDTLSALVKTREDRAGFTREVVARMAAAC
jgi:MoxR-like ATPase